MWSSSWPTSSGYSGGADPPREPWTQGIQIVVSHVREGRVWFAHSALVVADTPECLVLV